MDITLKRLNNQVHFKASNSKGNSIEFDGSPSIGGEGKAMNPMEVLLSAVAGCTLMDVVDILKKQRQDLEDVRVEIHGDRREEGSPKPFTGIHIKYFLKGKLDESKAARAIELSVEKYCSVKESLDPTIPVTYEFEIE